MYLELTEWAIPHPTLLSNTELLVNSLQFGIESQRHWFEELLDIARNPVKKKTQTGSHNVYAKDLEG